MFFFALFALFALSLALPRRAQIPALIGALALLAAAGHAGPFSNALAATYTDFRLLEFAAGMLIATLWMGQRLKIALPLSVAAIVSGFFFMTYLNFAWLMLAGAALVVTGSLGGASMPALRSAYRSNSACFLFNLSHTHICVRPRASARWTFARPRFDDRRRGLRRL